LNLSPIPLRYAKRPLQYFNLPKERLQPKNRGQDGVHSLRKRHDDPLSSPATSPVLRHRLGFEQPAPASHRRTLLVVALVVGTLSSLGITAASSATVVACSTSSLISAVSAATASSSASTITLTSGCTYTFSAPNNTTDGGNALPVITGNVTVDGNGAVLDRSTASGIPDFRFFDVQSGASLAINDLTLSNGVVNNGLGGGAIYNQTNASLSINGSTFTGNSSPATTGTSGGAIDNSGTLTVTTSSFSDNSAMEGGAIFNQGVANVSTTTFSGNTALVYGGGALLGAAGSMTIFADTFTGNTGPDGGAIDNDTSALSIDDSTFSGNTAGSNGGGAIANFGGPITISQSTLADNSSPYGANLLNYTNSMLSLSMSIVADGIGGPNCDQAAPITDNGYNLDSGSSCGFSSSKGSLSNTEPSLDPLASNGGPTQTMALPAGSPALDVIPTTAPGCTGTTDQRGVSRPQGSGCDVGAYELIVNSSSSQPPTTPTGLTATSVTSTSVTLSWNPSSNGVTGYTIFRDGTAIGSTGGPDATSFTDSTVAPSTTYQYTVEAFDGLTNSSSPSLPLSVTTSAPQGGVTFVQGASISTGSLVTSVTLQLGKVTAGDLLVGWFGQYNSSGQVQVSDNVNGAWTRISASTSFGSSGDIAFYYVEDAKAASSLTITISASSATYLQGAVSEFSGVATSGALDQAAATRGNSTSVSSGPTASVGAGELVVGGIITGGQPGTVTPGSSEGQAFTMGTQTSAGSADLEYIASSVAGTQDATATFSSATDWYAGVAVFKAG
jgi:predicted outer membrane repeat protein